MFKCLMLTLSILLTGCTTNQLHFAPYTAESELAAIEHRKVDAEIVSVSGVEACQKCTEMSKIVWHAANYNGSLYQGFAPIPINNWDDFIKTALESDTRSAQKANVVVNRIFLKTWNDPDYYACQSDITVFIGTSKYEGKAVIKIKSSGQRLLRADLAALNPDTLQAIRESLKAAYFNAIAATEKR